MLGRRHSPVRQSSGFTLVELLVGFAVVAILVGLLIPGLSGAREEARGAVCAQNLKQLGAGMMMYAAEHDGELPFGPKASAFGMGGNLYTSTGSPTSLITLSTGENVGLGLALPYLKDPKVFFCPGSDQPVDAAKELAKIGKKQVQSSYYYRHAGNTNITDYGSGRFSAPRLANLGENRRGQPIRAMVMDTLFLCSPAMKGFGAVPRTHHQNHFANVLYVDGHITRFENKNNLLTVDIRKGSVTQDALRLILEKFEMVDDGVLESEAEEKMR
jgi:prepilin-type processing-associated H-X9-DG protein